MLNSSKSDDSTVAYDAWLSSAFNRTAEYNNVAVRILVDSGGGVTTICPDYDQTLYIEGVELR